MQLESAGQRPAGENEHPHHLDIDFWLLAASQVSKGAHNNEATDWQHGKKVIYPECANEASLIGPRVWPWVILVCKQAAFTDLLRCAQLI